MDTSAILSGDAAALHKNEAGQTTHFETVGRNQDGTYNISSWHRDNQGVWGAYHFGKYDQEGALMSFGNFSSINFSDERTIIDRNPLIQVADNPRNEKAVTPSRDRAKSDKANPITTITIDEPWETIVPGPNESGSNNDGKKKEIVAPEGRVLLPGQNSEIETHYANKQIDYFPTALIRSQAKIPQEQSEIKKEFDLSELNITKLGEDVGENIHWSRQSFESPEFRRGVAALIENVPGDSPIEREINLYNTLAKDRSGALTPKARKIWIGSWEYTHERTRQYIINETIINVASSIGGFILERILLTLGSALIAAMAKGALKDSIGYLRIVAQLWNRIADQNRTLAILRTNKGYYFAVRGGPLSKNQKIIVDYLEKTFDFKFVKDIDGHAEFQVLTKAMNEGAKPELLVTSKPLCSTPGHMCAMGLMDSIGDKYEIDSSGLGVIFNHN